MKLNRTIFLITIIISSSASLFGQQQTRFRSGIFLHHSTGGCIWGPNGSATSVPDEMANYNSLKNLNDSDAVALSETSWPLNPWDNEWERWDRIFENKDTVEADIRPFFNSYPVIMIKSCFPSSSISAEGDASDTLYPTYKSIYNYKWHWRHIATVMREHPNNFFVIWTNAPLVAAATNDAEALLSDKFCRWAKDTLASGLDPVFGPFPENVYVFDFFHKLADANGKLPLLYAASSGDSHPNGNATSVVAPQLVQEMFDASIAYERPDIMVPPELILPPHDAINLPDTVMFTWRKVNGAESYKLQIANDSIFGSVEYQDSGIADSTAEVASLLNSRVYYWRVCSVKGENSSGWSPGRKFTTVNGSGFHLLVWRGWNMVSLPLRMIQTGVNIVFPTAVSDAYKFEAGSGYVSVDSLAPGEAYWIKFGYDQYVIINGDTILTDTIDVLQGWNMIGSITSPVPLTSILTEPADLLEGYAYSFGSSYVWKDTIEPGCGYWIKAKYPGKIILSYQ